MVGGEVGGNLLDSVLNAVGAKLRTFLINLFFSFFMFKILEQVDRRLKASPC